MDVSLTLKDMGIAGSSWAKKNFLAIFVLLLQVILSGAISFLIARHEVKSQIYLWQEQQRTESIQEFSKEIEQVKLLVRISASLHACLMNSPVKDFDAAYELCIQEQKRSNENPTERFWQAVSSLKTSLPSSILSPLEESFESISFYLSEIENNNLIVESWFWQDCPAYADLHESDSYDLTEGQKCSLVVQDYEDYVHRLSARQQVDHFSNVVGGEIIDPTTIDLFLVPGSQLLLTDYFLQMNNEIYNNLLSESNEVMSKLIEIGLNKEQKL